MTETLVKGIVWSLGMSAAYWAFTKFFPRNTEENREAAIIETDAEYKHMPDALPNLLMITLGIAIVAGGYFGLLSANAAYAHLDQGALLQVYPEHAIWWFAPGFSALAFPWLFVLWAMRRAGYRSQVNAIVHEGNLKTGWNGIGVMKALGIFIVLPIICFTLLAIPIHMSVMNDEVRVVHYGHFNPEIFRFADARRATWTDGYRTRDGQLSKHRDLLIDFSDGRQLSANAVGDGGTEPTDELTILLLHKTGLTPGHVEAKEDLPLYRP